MVQNEIIRFTVCWFLRKSFSLSISFELNYYLIRSSQFFLWHRDPDTRTPFTRAHGGLGVRISDSPVFIVMIYRYPSKSNLHLNDAISYSPFSKLNVSLEPRESECARWLFHDGNPYYYWHCVSWLLASGSPSIAALWNSRLPFFLLLPTFRWWLKESSPVRFISIRFWFEQQRESDLFDRCHTVA